MFQYVTWEVADMVETWLQWGSPKRQQPMKHHRLPTGFLIKVRYLGPTDHKCSRWIATYKRSSDQTFRATLPYGDDDGYSAALACLAKINAERADILPGDREFALTCSAHDHDAYCYVAAYPEAVA